MVGPDDALTRAIESHWQSRQFEVQRFRWTDDPTAFADQVSGMILVATDDDSDVNRRAFRWLQMVGPSLRTDSDAAFAIAVTRLGGEFGLPNGCRHPNSAGLAGLVKTARHEWPNVNCRVIDIGDGPGVAQELAVATTRHGPIEMGIASTGRCELQLKSTPTLARSSSPIIHTGDLVVISGGGRGVTTEAAFALAAAYRPTLLLLGRSSLPDAEPDWLKRLESPSDVKKAILDHATQRLTPKQLHDEFQKVLANRDIHANLKRLRDAGAVVEYQAVDIRDQEAVRRVVAAMAQKFGPVRGIVHGAGVLADRKIEDKTVDQFDAVYQTKVDGLRALLESANNDALRFIALYSSSTARFGRIGQCDYAAANEVLNATARRLAHEMPRCRVVSLNWGPWAGGMVTPGLRALFESEGVGLIPLHDGGRFLVDEFRAIDRPTDVVVLGSAPLTQSCRLSTSTHPWLDHHQLNGHPVLPLAVMVEAFAQTLRPHRDQDTRFGIEHIRVLRPIAMTNGKALGLQVNLDLTQKSLSLKHVDSDAADLPMCSARLVDSIVPNMSPTPTGRLEPFPLSVDDAYEKVLFHGPAFQCITQIEGFSSNGIRVHCHGSPRHIRWWKELAPTDRMTDPLAIDAALQAIILWAWAERNVLSIPVSIGRYQQHVQDFPLGPFVIDIQVSPSKGQMFHASAIIYDKLGQRIADLMDCEYVATPDLARAFGKSSRPTQRVP